MAYSLSDQLQPAGSFGIIRSNDVEGGVREYTLLKDGSNRYYVANSDLPIGRRKAGMLIIGKKDIDTKNYFYFLNSSAVSYDGDLYVDTHFNSDIASDGNVSAVTITSPTITNIINTTAVKNSSVGLDQFKNAVGNNFLDGDNKVQIIDNEILINNKNALIGYPTTGLNQLIINGNTDFSKVIINGDVEIGSNLNVNGALINNGFNVLRTVDFNGSNSISGRGYITLPMYSVAGSIHIVIQWTVATIPSNGPVTVTFPTPFSNGVLNITSTNRFNCPQPPNVLSYSKTNCVLDYNSGQLAGDVFVLAIGY